MYKFESPTAVLSCDVRLGEYLRDIDYNPATIEGIISESLTSPSRVCELPIHVGLPTKNPNTWLREQDCLGTYHLDPPRIEVFFKPDFVLMPDEHGDPKKDVHLASLEPKLMSTTLLHEIGHFVDHTNDVATIENDANTRLFNSMQRLQRTRMYRLLRDVLQFGFLAGAAHNAFLEKTPNSTTIFACLLGALACDVALTKMAEKGIEKYQKEDDNFYQNCVSEARANHFASAKILHHLDTLLNIERH